MSRQDERGLWRLWVTVLTLGLVGQAVQPAIAWQDPSSQLYTEDLDPWTKVFKPGEDLDQIKIEIKIGDRLHPDLLKGRLGEKGFTCELDESSSVLTRQRPERTGWGSEPHQPAIDDIPIRTKKPGEATDADESGWIGVELPGEAIKRTSPGQLTLTIQGGSGLRARVGAGVFSGSLKLRLSHRDLEKGDPFRLIQPLTIVIVGSRLVSVALEPAGAEAVRVGTKPTVKAVIESVETGRQDAAKDLGPGWWLEVKDTKLSRNNSSVLARLPLPIPEKPDGPALRVADKGEDRYWDTIQKPEGKWYERVDDWRDELILQQIVKEDGQLAKLKDVSIKRHTISTSLPALFQPGALIGQVFWDPVGQEDREPTPPDRPKGAIATKMSAGVEIRSGLRVSTDLPVTGETFWIWAVRDLGTATNKSRAPEDLPSLSAYVWKEDSPGQPWKPIAKVELKRQDAIPTEPNLARYRGPFHFEYGQTGYYHVKLYTGSEPALPETEGESKTIPPKEWIDDLRDAEVPVSVLLEGVTSKGGEPSDSPLNENPLKVFIGSEPPWWVWTREPGFEDLKYTNHRPNLSLVSKVFTSQAMALRWAAPQNEKLMNLRYRGIYYVRPNDSQPTSGDEPDEKEQKPHAMVVGDPYKKEEALKVTVENWVGKSEEKAPHWEWSNKPDQNGQDSPAEDLPIALANDANAAKELEQFQFVDFQVALADAQQKDARAAGVRTLLARFVISGLDDKGRPFGRVYTRPLKVVVRSMWDELWDAGEVLVPVGVILVIVAIILIRKFWPRPPGGRTKKVHQEDAPASSILERDYMTGLEPAQADYALGQDRDHNSPAPPEANPPSRRPATPTTEPAPSYLEETRSESDPGGPSYLD